MTAAYTTPIIFSAPMVRALLDGRKTQTRRLVTSQWANLKMHFDSGERCFVWVREAFWHACSYPVTLPSGEAESGNAWAYRLIHHAADGKPENTPNRHYPTDLRGSAISAPAPYAIWFKRPSIHMPRWASRLTLEVTDVRLQRLQDISESDAIAEGFELTETDCDGGRWYSLPEWDRQAFGAIQAYCSLWESLHGKCSWEANPEVIAVSFRVHQQNIDTLLTDRGAI